jgi:hypothetical protein
MDIIRAYQEGQQYRRQRELQGLMQQYQLGGGAQREQALRGISAISPEVGGQLLGQQRKQQQFEEEQLLAQQQQQQRELSAASKLASGVLDTPPEQRNEVYKASLKVAQNYGLDVSQLPEDYTEDAERYLQGIVNVASGAGQREAYKPLSREGKIQQDYRAGLISREQRDKALIGRPTTEIKMGVGETEEQKAWGKKRIEAHYKRKGEARQAEGQLMTLNELENLISSPETYVGAGAGAIKDIKRIAGFFGFEPKGTTNAEVIESLSNQMALKMRNPESGFGMPGSISDRDVKFLKATVPGLTKTKEGNLELIRILRKLQERKIEISDLESQYLEQNDTLKGFEKVRREFVKDNPMFGEQETATINFSKASNEELLRGF